MLPISVHFKSIERAVFVDSRVASGLSWHQKSTRSKDVMGIVKAQICCFADVCFIYANIYVLLRDFWYALFYTAFVAPLCPKTSTKYIQRFAQNTQMKEVKLQGMERCLKTCCLQNIWLATVLSLVSFSKDCVCK